MRPERVEIGRRQWKKESGYHQQARVENTFFRYKTIIGRPESFAIGAYQTSRDGWAAHQIRSMHQRRPSR
jgi:hypothetical protein